MERVGQRESFLYNYAAERSHDSPSSSTSSTSIPRRINSDDVDFNDVFGGPPRRFSARTSDGAMSTEDAMSIRSFSSEKPVFGEESSVNRRNHQSNDFFDDIYRGGDTPGRDFVSSLPGSRIMSPSRPLPPKLEPFGASLPAHFRFAISCLPKIIYCFDSLVHILKLLVLNSVCYVLVYII